MPKGEKLTIMFGVSSGTLKLKYKDAVLIIDSMEAFEEAPIEDIAKESIRELVVDWFKDQDK